MRTATEATVDIPNRRIDRLPTVKIKTGLGTTSIYQGVKEGWFPKPIKLIGRSVGWVSDEIDGWVERRIADSRNSQV
jgi:prophage regulatory protein